MQVQKNKRKKHKMNFKVSHLAIFAVILFVAGIFAFGPRIRGMVESKLIARGNYYFNGGAYDLAKAEKYFKVATYVDHATSYPHYQLARVLFEKGDFKNAILEIDRSLVLSPENKRAFYIRGLIDGYAKNYKAAEDDFQKFIAFSPKEWAGHNDLAWAYYQDGDYQNAADAAQKGLDVVSGNAWLLNGLGVSLQALGKNDEAKVALDQATSITKNLTADDWKRAYPGNDAESAPWDLAQFKTDVNFNLQLAANPLSSGKGKFQSACSSSLNGVCSGISCTQVTCDPDHPGSTGNDEFGVPYCGPLCNTSYDCGCSPKWTPTCADTVHCNQIHGYSPYCNVNIAEARTPGSCFQTTSFGGDWCVVQSDGCGTSQWAGVDACPLNCGDGACNNGETCNSCPQDCGSCVTNSPSTVSIANPTALPATFNPSATDFSINVQDPDGDKITVTASMLTCPSGIQPLLGEDTGAANTTTQQNISATIGGLTAGTSCTWNVTVSDGSHPVSASVVFQTQAAPSTTSCSCGSLQTLCIGRLPTASEMCTAGTPNPLPANLDASGYQVNWSCDPDGTCTGSVSCSAQGQRACGWVETNP